MPVDSKLRILLFCRPYLVPDFRANFEPLSADYDFFLLTDGKGNGDGDTREAFYRHLKAPSRPSILTREETEDCILRCRLLRNLQRQDAERRVGAMAAALDEWYTRLQPKLTVSHAVDDYVTHLLSILARKRNILYLAYCFSFFPGCAQLLRYENGLPFNGREPESEEIEKVIAAITGSGFRQNYSQLSSRYSFRTHVFRVLRYLAKRAYFTARGILERDPLHVHYVITEFIAERRHLADYPPSSIFDEDWRGKLSGSDYAIYFPLGYFPESTIDYWTLNTSIIEYENKVVQMVAALSRNYRLLIKEHPHMVGIRSPDFYEKLRAFDNATLIGPFEYSSEVMRQCDAIVLGGGSGGVEAVLADVPVFTYCDTIYWFRPSRAHFLDLNQIEAWPDVISDGLRQARPLSDDEKRRFIGDCLASTLSVRPGSKRWPLTDTAQTHKAIELALNGGREDACRPAGAPQST